jgi:hypothetical protein
MAKKGKKAKAAAAAASSNQDTDPVEITSLTPSDTELRLLKNRDLFDQVVAGYSVSQNSSSFSLPSSPVIKAIRSPQPSPALSATVTDVVDEDFQRTSLAPLSIGEILDPGAVPEIDWSLFDTQPVFGRKRNKLRQSRLRSPVREEVIEEEPEQVSVPRLRRH